MNFKDKKVCLVPCAMSIDWARRACASAQHDLMAKGAHMVVNPMHKTKATCDLKVMGLRTWVPSEVLREVKRATYTCLCLTNYDVAVVLMQTVCDKDALATSTMICKSMGIPMQFAQDLGITAVL